MHPGGIKTAIARNARNSAKEDGEESAKFFDKKLARMSPGAGRGDHPQGRRGQQGPGAGRHRRARGAHAAKLLGSRYQDVVASRARKLAPTKIV